MSVRARLGVPLSVLLLVGCQPNVFYVEKKGQTTVSGDPLNGLLSTFPTIGSFTDMDFNQDQTFQSEGVLKNQVSSVLLDKVQLQIVSPGDQDFSFLQSLQLAVRAGDTEQEVAHKDGIDQLNLPPPNPVLKMDLDGTELRPFVTAPSMSLIVRGKGHAPPQDTTLEATVRLRVAVKLF